MNYKMIGRLLSYVILIEAGFMLFPLTVSLIDGTGASTFAFGVTIAGMVALGLLILLLCRKASIHFYESEGFVCVGISWIVMSLLGCIPFVINGDIPNYIDALFEMVSGFTTTGASVVPNIELCSRATILWRSVSNWLGGMGILVFMLAILPTGSGGFTMHLMRAESPGPSVGKLAPKMRQTALILYAIYLGITVLNIIALMISGLGFFDAVCAAMSTAGTGGFGAYADSFTSFTPATQIITTVFMLLYGVNFSVYYLLLLGKISNVLRDEELRLYVSVFVISSGLIVWNLCQSHFYPTVGETIRHASFQVSSIMTTTGFATTDFDLWPSFSKILLLILMLFGACAGSTGGGMKMSRLLIYAKTMARNVRRALHPNKVSVVRINGAPVSETVINLSNAYLVSFVALHLISFLLISWDGFSMETNISAVVALSNNIGPGFGDVGPTMNYAGYSIFSKIIFCIDMLAGRLEIFPILVLFSRFTWNRKA
ncbi:MAG: TrkH family potassium uptake protein [Clostridia bacterium]|nr:TrkH family potassium uptake protein [Clostridia bacterium]